MSASSEDLNLKEVLKRGIIDDLNAFNIFVEWTEDEKSEFTVLLNQLKSPFDGKVESKKSKGDRLERLVSFIIDKSYFYKIYKNVRTETNEIDEIIVFSEEGRQALYKYGLSRGLIPISTDMFLGECKNYEKALNVTYVGKFYSLLSTTGNTFGILFTQKGLTGNEAGYKEGYGLTKVIRMVERYKNNNDFYIITFTLDDYEQLLKGHTFFDIVKAKMLALCHASDYHVFLCGNKHSNQIEVKAIIDELS